MIALRGRTVLVVGGTSGIGLAVARQAAAEGATVIVAGRRPDRVREAVDSLPGTPRGIAPDLRSDDDAARLLDDLDEVHHLVFTAGNALAPAGLSDTTTSSAIDQFSVRYFAALTVARLVHDRVAADGSLGFSSGTVSRRPAPGSSISAGYAAAVEGMTRALAVELAPLRVNAVLAGLVRTPLWSGLPDADGEASYASGATASLTGRVAEADDVAAAHLHLMRNPSITGTVMVVDNGALLA